VTFGGFSDDMAEVWSRHHGLVLPSRCEGLPLVVVEAMLSGRVPIVTDVGGNREAVDDEVTGFVAAAATEDALDDAMERAWQRRGEWRAIGAAASLKIRTLVPADPAAVMAAMLHRLVAQPESNAPRHPSAPVLPSESV
jgi:glycosyltransferase involved in cell wall biosynthesis